MSFQEALGEVAEQKHQDDQVANQGSLFMLSKYHSSSVHVMADFGNPIEAFLRVEKKGYVQVPGRNTSQVADLGHYFERTDPQGLSREF